MQGVHSVMLVAYCEAVLVHIIMETDTTDAEVKYDTGKYLMRIWWKLSSKTWLLRTAILRPP